MEIQKKKKSVAIADLALEDGAVLVPVEEAERLLELVDLVVGELVEARGHPPLGLE